MTSRFMTSIAIAALITGTGAALGQATGTKNAPPSGMSEQQPPSTAPHSRPDSSGKLNKSQPPDSRGDASRSQSQRHSGSSQNNSERNAGEARPNNSERSAREPPKNERTKNSKSGDARRHDNMNAHRKNDRMNDQRHGNNTNRSESRSQTTGHAGAEGKLSTEQKTKITSAIREQRVQPETDINFNISVGTHVPRTVHFHPLPTEIITVYPDWRGYDFFVVNNRIVVVNPRTLAIVAVLPA